MHKLLLIWLSIFPLFVNAQDGPWVVKKGFVQEVVNTNLVRVTVYDGERRGLITLRLKGIEQDLTSCKLKINSQICEVISDYIDNKAVGIIIDGADSNHIVNGDLLVENKSLVFYLVSNGYARVDHTGIKNHALIIQEGKARCLFRGVWNSLSKNPKVVEQCQKF